MIGLEVSEGGSFGVHLMSQQEKKSGEKCCKDHKQKKQKKKKKKDPKGTRHSGEDSTDTSTSSDSSSSSDESDTDLHNTWDKRQNARHAYMCKKHKERKKTFNAKMRSLACDMNVG